MLVEDLITSLLPQMPTVGVLLLVFWWVRKDIIANREYMEGLIDKLVDKLNDRDREP